MSSWVRGFPAPAVSLPFPVTAIVLCLNVGSPFDYFKLSTFKWAPLQTRCQLRSCASAELVMKIKGARSWGSFSKSKLLCAGVGWVQCALRNNGILCSWSRILTHPCPPPLPVQGLGLSKELLHPGSVRGAETRAGMRELWCHFGEQELWRREDPPLCTPAVPGERGQLPGLTIPGCSAWPLLTWAALSHPSRDFLAEWEPQGEVK